MRRSIKLTIFEFLVTQEIIVFDNPQSLNQTLNQEKGKVMISMTWNLLGIKFAINKNLCNQYINEMKEKGVWK